MQFSSEFLLSIWHDTKDLQWMDRETCTTTTEKDAGKEQLKHKQSCKRDFEYRREQLHQPCGLASASSAPTAIAHKLQAAVEKIPRFML